MAAVLGLTLAAATQAQPPGLRDGRIGYVMTNLFWSVYQTEDASECPQGFNDGPREQFEALYADTHGRDLQSTQLHQEVQTWLPSEISKHQRTSSSPCRACWKIWFWMTSGVP